MTMDLDKARLALAELRDSLPIQIEYVVMTAQLTRAKFNALRKEGFTEAQAIELCRTNNILG